MPIIPWDEYKNNQGTPPVDEPEAPEPQEISGFQSWDEYEKQLTEQPPAPRQPLQHTPKPSPQLFPPGQDHVAREVLGLTPKPFQRSEILPESHFGILGDVGSGLADGFLRTGELALQMARAYDEPGGIDTIRNITTAGIEKIREWEDEYPRIFKPSQETQDSYFRRSVYGGLVNFLPSAFSGLIGGAAGAAAGSLGGPVGAGLGFVLGFGGGAGLMFGSAEYDSFMEEADAYGIPRDQVFTEAMTSAFVEGGGEMVADIISLVVFGPTGGLSIASKGALKEMMRMPIRQLIKDFAKAAPAEVLTEMAQGASQVHLRNKAGMDAGSPWEAALESIGPALVMTALFGAAGGAKQTLHLRQMRKALENGEVDPAKRQAAADFIEKEIKDKDFAELWKFNAKQFIDAGYGIPIDRPMAEFLSWGESSKWSPEMAAQLAEGKDIKLLPNGQGFVLVGETYDPDEKAEYDEYSPELAEQLVQAKETKLLPDGQGFTIAGDITVYSPQLAEKLRKEKEQKKLEAPDRRAEAPEAPPVIPIPDVEAAARGVEAAIETGTPEDLAQAEQRLARRQQEEAKAPDKTLSLVRSVLKATPEATIGETYRKVKELNPQATRQEVAKLFRQETKPDIPLTQKDMKITLKDLGHDEFNHLYNPAHIQARLVEQLQREGHSRDVALQRSHEFMVTYENNYRKVTEEALKKRAAEQAKKEKAAEKAKKAAEAPKKLKAKPKAKKPKLKAREPKKAVLARKGVTAKPGFSKATRDLDLLPALPWSDEELSRLRQLMRVKDQSLLTQPIDKEINKRVPGLLSITPKKPSAAETVAAMEKPKKEPKRKKTSKALTAKETEKVAKEGKAREEEVKPSKFAIGTKVKTDDGGGEIIGSPQKGQWAVKMSDGWAKGEILIFAETELESGKKDAKARLGKVVNGTYEDGVKKAGAKDNILVQKGKTQGKHLLVQIKSRQKAVSEEDKTYDKIYDKREGYARPADFWEIPMWMGEAANTFEDADLFIVRDPVKAVDELNKAGYPTVMFSVLDANKAVIKEIASKYKGQVIVGGYIDPKYFAGLKNVTFHESVKQAAQSLGVKYKPGVSYAHFKDTETVPRLCLSKGCKHQCAFCVVPKTILTNTKKHIANQLNSFRDLKFKLIYIDDKTFGQAKNYTDLVEINRKIRKFNPDFQGFIIQTTAPQLLNMSDQFIQDSGIQYIELGVESYNDDILSKVKKPHRTKQLDKAVVKIRKNGKSFIPNILVGLTGEGWSETRDSYENTAQFLEKNRDIISHVNIYNLALYEGTELHEQLKVKSDTDLDENVVTKSYHKDQDIHEEFYKRILEFSSEMLDKDPRKPIPIVRYTSTGNIKEMDPAIPGHRTGIRGEELKRLKDDAEAPARLHYYIEGGPEEPHIASLPFKYRAYVPQGRFYDTFSDPLNLRQVAKREGQAVADPNLAEKIMKEHGYIGYYSQDRGPAIAVVFDKLKVERVKPGKAAMARSSESIAKEAKAAEEGKYKAIIRKAFPTATRIAPVQGYIAGYDIEQDDAFHVTLPNGARIQVKFNAMPELSQEQMDKFREDYMGIEDTQNPIPFALWVEDGNASITGSGTIWLAGLGDLQTDIDHEVLHAAKAIVLTKAEDRQLEKDFGTEEQQAMAYEKWRKTNRSHKIFDKIRSFFRRIAEAMGVGKGGSYKIFRMIEEGKVWEREFRGKRKLEGMGKLKANLYSQMGELPKYKKKPIGQAVAEDILHDREHWDKVGAVLYIEGLKGKAWTNEMIAHLKEHYLLDKIPQRVLTTIRQDSQHRFKRAAVQTLNGKLPTMDELLEMEKRGIKEGGMVWYDEADGISMLVEDENGDVVARSAKRELEEYFGEDAELMAGLIAHLSSGLQVPLNTTKAIEVYIAHKLGLGFKGTYQVSKANIDKFLETRKTSGPKREPFLQAILGDADAIVIDRWMARVLNYRSKNPKTGEWETSTGASKEQRELLIEWVKRGAKRLGISNRAYQALIWAGKKAIDEEASGRPTGSLAPLAKVIEEKVKLKGILAKDIPEGKWDEYFVLKGVDRWAIHKDSFMPLADMELFPDFKTTRKPNALKVPRKPADVISKEEQAELDKQQPRMFAKMTESTVVEDSLDDIFGTQHKGVLQKMKDGIKRMKEFRTLVLDEFHPILKHLGKKTYILHRMLNGVHASVEALMVHGKLSLSDEGHIVADGRHRGFAQWAKKHGKDAVNVLRWAAAKRSEHLEKTNPDWIKNEEFLTQSKRERIYNEIGEAPEGGGTWEELHAEFDEFHQSVLDIAQKAGLIDEVVREDWRDLIYVPFYRVFEDTATREEFLANPKKAKDIAAKAKPIKGSKRKIGEPIENVIANWGYMIQESMRNQARREAYVNAKMLNEVGDLMRDIDYQEIKHTIISDNGVISYETEKGDDMVLSFLDNGKRKYFSVNDADLYYALTTMNAQHFGKLFNAFFGGPKRLLTYGATFGPAFRVANAVRDTLHTWMITPGMSFKPFIDTFKGFMSSMREDEAYVAALAAGGLHGGSYVHAEDPTSMSKFTSRLLGREENSTLLDTGKKVLDFWDKLGAASENAARVQLHKNLIEQGETGLEAAYQSRDLLDFALKGQAKIVLALIRTIPFLGARTQGNYRLARAAIDPKTRWSMAVKGSILAAASLALWAAFKDDDRYKELEDYDKWTYYHWWVGDEHFRMPKPFEVGAIFSSMFESAANTMTDNEEIEFMGRFFKHTFTETFAVGVPQTIKPLAELWANKSFFTGRPIEGRAMKLLEPGERAEPWTSETLRVLGKGLNISPKKMEAVLRGYLATISAFALGGTDQVARWVGDFPERPTYRKDDYPLVGRFWKEGKARNTKYATRLYEAMEESDRLVQTVKHYMIQGDMEKAKKFANKNLGLYASNKMLNRTRKKLTDLRKVMKDVERSRTLTRDEKREQIEKYTDMRNKLVKEVYEALGKNVK